MKKPQLLIIAFICCCFAWATAQDEALIEAESFLDKGGWMTDP